MEVKKFVDIIGAEFYTGVPDSLLKAFCDYLMHAYGVDRLHHVVAANEGNCAALAAGYYLAAGKTPVVYMQNSGEGNMINPLASLLSSRVCAVPVIFVIGWRGEPGMMDEPQHAHQGQVTLQLLDDMDVHYFIVSSFTKEEELRLVMEGFRKELAEGRQAAFVIRKDALSYEGSPAYQNSNHMSRENVIRQIIRAAGEDAVISTTGKASRELYEIRKENGQGHRQDFLTAGSMGHCSSIALGVALHKPQQKIWCIDGDGAVLMHMGALALIGACAPPNMIHVVINNGAHESVGGMPTAAAGLSYAGIAKACGYPSAVSVHDYDALEEALRKAKERGVLTFIEAECAIGSRKNLGRPAESPLVNKQEFMKYLQCREKLLIK